MLVSVLIPSDCAVIVNFRCIHTKEKPYPCPHCDNSYASQDKVWKHINSVHPEKSNRASAGGDVMILPGAPWGGPEMSFSSNVTLT